jgi:hypothetical protein
MQLATAELAEIRRESGRNQTAIDNQAIDDFVADG